MDSLPPDILIRIFDKSRLFDQLISYRLINNKFRQFIPTEASRIQRVNTTDLITISRKLRIFTAHEDSMYFHTTRRLHEVPAVKLAYKNLLLYFFTLNGISFKCISFTTPILLDSTTIEKLAMLCPHISEIAVGYNDYRVQNDVQCVFNSVFQALPDFPELKILHIITYGGESDFLQAILSRLNLQKLRNSSRRVHTVVTADPSLLEELVMPAGMSGPYREMEDIICDIFPNLRRHYLTGKRWYAPECVRPGEAERNYRRLHMLRASCYIGGKLWFVDDRLCLDFPYLQSMNIDIPDDGSCARFINALQMSRNWKALNVELYDPVSNDVCLQFLRALFYTTAVRLKILNIRIKRGCLNVSEEQILQMDLALDATQLVFGETLRECEMEGSGVLLLAGKIASVCKGLKKLSVADPIYYITQKPGLQEPLRKALARFQEANLRNLRHVSLLKMEPSSAYHLIQCFRGSKLHGMHLQFKDTSDEISDARCSSLLREDAFPYLRMVTFQTYQKDQFSYIFLNILRNLPALRNLTIELWSTDWVYDGAVLRLEPNVWQQIAQHPNLQFCSIKPRIDISSEDTFANLCNTIGARGKIEDNGRVLQWLYMEFDRGYLYELREQNDNKRRDKILLLC